MLIGPASKPPAQTPATSTPGPVVPGAGLERLSLNTATTKNWTLAEAVAGCVKAGVPGIGVWRDRVAEHGAVRAGQLIRAAGLTATSLCRAGFFTAADRAGRIAALADNRLAVREAADIGTGVLVLVCGGLPPGSRDLPAARRMVADGVGELSRYAAQYGVHLALEPLHPMFCADRAVVSTLGQALDIVEEIGGDNVGVVVDTYHLWWDPQLYAQIKRAGRRILAFQICDWVLPLPADAVLGRGHVGDGYIDVAAISRAVADTGYAGYTEVEIFNQRVWDTPGGQTLDTVVSRYRF